MVSEPGGSRFRINVNILLKTSASKANDVAKSDDEEETFLLSSSSLSSSSVWFPVDQLDASTKVLAYSSNLVITFSPSFSSSSDFFLINERIARCTTSSSKLLLLLLLIAFWVQYPHHSRRNCRRSKVVLKLLRDKNDDDVEIGMEAVVVVFANPIVVLVDGVIIIIFML
jgi:hypothetical protein